MHPKITTFDLKMKTNSKEPYGPEILRILFSDEGLIDVTADFG
ncbi:hypothetical protein SAMN05421640_0836 [Ekhidna lutea]|uniref:Uncharacterized protein n=1 Tax=Ekhidna lutea TaxID=447679 RepID=A0A239FWB0_EKHLU|nr:hypothetical protein SAMN05421640_0836 [Ekhidna lutea]